VALPQTPTPLPSWERVAWTFRSKPDEGDFEGVFEAGFRLVMQRLDYSRSSSFSAVLASATPGESSTFRAFTTPSSTSAA
jgi:hypothetical protein